MSNAIERDFAVFFPLFFIALWLAVTTSLAVISGWFRLMARFPNRSEEPLLRIRGQSGSMGPGVAMGGILTLSVCPSGLRVGIMRLFGPFCRDFLVPWDEIEVSRKNMLLRPSAALRFGRPVVGSLTVPAHVADRLARAAGKRWPESGSFPQETHRDTVRRVVTRWALKTCAAALFFILVPLAVAPAGARPPIAGDILFPAIVFGIAAIVGYVRDRN